MFRIGDHRNIIPVLLLAACFQAAAVGQEFKAGGVALTLPGPTSDFPEVGDKLRTTFFELFAPSTSRLLSAYVSAQVLSELSQGKAPADLDLGTYGMVEVPRQAEYANCTPEDFEKVLESAGPSFGASDVKRIDELALDELSARLKSVGAKPIEVGRPEKLGGLFRKLDVAGFAMLATFKSGDRGGTMAMGCAFVRVKQRLLFVYLYRKYESPESVSWMRKNLETWCDAILAKNR
jgi:hypothetical protein